MFRFLFVVSFTLVKSYLSSDFSKESAFQNLENHTTIEQFASTDKCKRGEYPFVVSIQLHINSDLVHFCSGAIYDSRSVLSAAHCFEDIVNQKGIFVIAGKVSLDESDNLEQISLVKRVLIHNRYRKYSDNRENDIALLLLEKELRFNAFVQPIDVPYRDFKGSILTAVGWGKIQKGGFSSDMQKAVVPVVPDAKCEVTYGYGEINDNMICVGHTHPKHTPCTVDSGSPVVARACKDALRCKFELIGIISSTGRRGNKPTVCTRVSKYAQWINHYAERKK